MAVAAGEEDDQRAERAYAACLTQSRGCVVIDSGATAGFVSLNAIDRIQQDRMDWGEESAERRINGSPSTKRFKFARSEGAQAAAKVELPIDEGILAGTEAELNLLDMPNNDTPALFGINCLVKNRVVIDFEGRRITFKGDPTTK